MSCDCIKEVNAKLAEHNTLLVFTLFGNPSRVLVDTTKLDDKKRGKPKAMIASFCPFCGVKYAPEGAA